MESKLKPCRKHNRLPRLKEVKSINDPYINQLYQAFKRMEYVCDACEVEREEALIRPLIDEWNRKQAKEAEAMSNTEGGE